MTAGNNLLAKVSVAFGAVFFGTVVTLDMKWMYQTESMGVDGKEKPFKKPWFMVFAMFLGMSLTLCLFMLQMLMAKRQRVKEGYVSLQGNPATSERTFSNMSTFGVLWRCIFPACCDMMASGLNGVGFLFVAASVLSICRGANIMFTALFSVLFLKRRLTASQIFGLLLAFLALIFVGAAASHCAFLKQFADNEAPTARVKDTSTIDTDSVGTPFMLISDQSVPGGSPRYALFGIFCILMAQMFQATQYVWEERMMKDLKLPPLLLIGIEGLFGCIVMICAAFPILGYLPGSDYGGCRESLWDSWVMLRNNGGHLVAKSLVLVFSITGLNCCSFMVTKLLSSVFRALLMTGMRTLVIWVTDLTLFYAVTNTFGEAWIYPYSEVQAVGFTLCVIGALFYGKFLSLKTLDSQTQVTNSIRQTKMQNESKAAHGTHKESTNKLKLQGA